MIFITLGSQKFQFNRLLKEIDKLIENNIITDEVFAQTGYSDYKPLNYKYEKFLDREAFAKMQAESDMVITHGGTGAIIGAVKNGKKVVACPRLSKYGEHVDDHQIQVLQEFESMNLISVSYDVENLGKVIEECKNSVYNKYVSNTHSIIDSIESYLNQLSGTK